MFASDLFQLTEQGCRLRIKVTPKAAKSKVGELCLDAQGFPMLKVAVTEIPEKGRANDAVLALLVQHFHLKRHQVRLHLGLNTKIKTVEFLIDPQKKQTPTELAEALAVFLV